MCGTHSKVPVLIWVLIFPSQGVYRAELYSAKAEKAITTRYRDSNPPLFYLELFSKCPFGD